jgi:D-tyrosyl-tRNA(Tyr) deacylase
MILLGITHGDDEEKSLWLANKVAGLRIFEDDAGKMNRSLLDTGGSALVVSQFTLYGDCRKGRRPSFTHAARPEIAEPLCERFMDDLRAAGVDPVESGVFGAYMQVEIHNDGPVTLIVEHP